MLVDIFNMLRQTIVLTTLLAAAFAAPRSHNLQIINGHDTDISLHPWQVSLIETKVTKDSFCGGSIISDSWIVTAAHCFHYYPEKEFAVNVGSTYRTKDGERYGIKSIIIHPDWDTEHQNNDIALVQLSTPISSPKVSSIDLPFQKEEVPDGTIFSVTGWGQLNGGGRPEILQEVLLPLAPWKKCQDSYKDFPYKITKNMICLGDYINGSGACYGDSGGPAVANKKLFGIVSFGNGCGDPKQPSVYTKVSNYINWIKDTTGLP